MTTPVATGLRIVAAVRSGAHLVTRPHSPVVHLVPPGPLTPSGWFVPRAARTVCQVRTGRLHVLPHDPAGVVLAGKRFCRRCTATLPPSLGVAVHSLRTRADDQEAFGHLRVEDFAVIAPWCLTVEETHQISRVVSVVHGPEPFLQPTTPGPARARWELNQAILRRRQTLRVAQMTVEDHEDIAAAKEEQTEHVAAAVARRRREDTETRVNERANAGMYLTPWERDLLNEPA